MHVFLEPDRWGSILVHPQRESTARVRANDDPTVALAAWNLSEIRYPPSGLSELGRWLLIGFMGLSVSSVVPVWTSAALLRQSALRIFASLWTLIVAGNASSCGTLKSAAIALPWQA